MIMNSIDAALGLRPLEQTEEAEVIQHVPSSLPAVPASLDLSETELLARDENLQDIEKARKNIEQIVELGNDSLNEMITLAKQSESPRAFEVAATLMKTLLDANRDFVDISMRKKYAKEEILNPKKDEEASQTNVTNNNLIVSTTDLLKMLKGD
jgi:hypothetical protein